MKKQNSKQFSKSLTVRVNSAVTGLGVVLLSLPELLMQALAFLTSDEVARVQELLPEDARGYVQLVVRVLGAVLTLIGAANVIIRKVRTSQPLDAPRLTRRGGAAVVALAALMAALMAALLVGCGSTGQKVIDAVPIACEQITTPDSANNVLGDAQAVRIAARDTVAALYVSAVIDEEAVRRYDKLVDHPFTELYAKARKLVDDGAFDQFKAICDQVTAYVEKFRAYTGGGK